MLWFAVTLATRGTATYVLVTPQVYETVTAVYLGSVMHDWNHNFGDKPSLMIDLDFDRKRSTMIA